MKIRAAVLNRMGAEPPYAISKPLRIETLELDEPGRGELLVKIAAAGLCHSDLSVINGDRPRPTPMALGHESAGVVAALGEDVTDLSVGDHVVMVFMPSCGHCLSCAEGRPALCEPGAAANGAGTLLSGKRRLHCDGAEINHHLGVSGFADYAVVSRRSVVKVDRDLPLDEDGGKINARTTEDLVELLQVDGQEYLLYKAFPIQVALIRGTTADTLGNITMDREALTLDALLAAMAARNSRGFVIAQVERIAQAGSLDARRVQVPGVLVDCVVLAEPENHRQTYGVAHNGAFSGQFRVPTDRIEPLHLDERKVMARRAALELPMGGVVNLGIGMPEGVAAVAAEEKVLRYVTLTAEPGVIGGIPQGGLNFGAALNPDAVIQQNQQFDFYDGGGLDLAVLGMAQVDVEGNVNVSRFGPRLAGAGGFINISQNARKVVFAGAFTAGGLVTAIENGRLRIVNEGKSRKFIARVEQITFSGSFAGEAGQPVLYVTERCVLHRTADGVELTEVAPGIDIERDILAHMGFRPIVREPRLMDARLFQPEAMGIEHILLGFSLAERISFDTERNTLFINYEGFQVRTTDDVELVRREVESRCKAIGQRIAVVVNYDGFTLDPMVSDAFFSMITYLQHRYYTSASRYTTSAFMRLKLGASLAERALAPHVFETLSEAQDFIAAQEPGSPTGRPPTGREPYHDRGAFGAGKP